MLENSEEKLHRKGYNLCEWQTFEDAGKLFVVKPILDSVSLWIKLT